MTFESWCERDHLIAFDCDPDIVGVAAQPSSLRSRRAGRCLVTAATRAGRRTMPMHGLIDVEIATVQGPFPNAARDPRCRDNCRARPSIGRVVPSARSAAERFHRWLSSWPSAPSLGSGGAAAFIKPGEVGGPWSPKAFARLERTVRDMCQSPPQALAGKLFELVKPVE